MALAVVAVLSGDSCVTCVASVNHLPLIGDETIEFGNTAGELEGLVYLEVVLRINDTAVCKFGEVKAAAFKVHGHHDALYLSGTEEVLAGDLLGDAEFAAVKALVADGLQGNLEVLLVHGHLALGSTSVPALVTDMVSIVTGLSLVVVPGTVTVTSLLGKEHS